MRDPLSPSLSSPFNHGFCQGQMTTGIICFSLQYLPFVLCCSLLQRIISSRSKRAASSEQKVFCQNRPQTLPLLCAACFLSLSLSLSLCDSFVILEFCHDNFMDCKNPKQVRFFVWEKSKALKFIFLGLSPELVCQKGDSFSMYLSTICVG